MSAEQNKARVRRFIEEAWNKGNLAVVDELVDPSYVGHDPSSPAGDIRGPDGYKQLIRTYRNAVPDLHWTVDEQVAEGDKVVTRAHGDGTQTGELFGIPATGKTFEASGVTITRWSAEGKAVHDWFMNDNLGVLQQLGVIPTPGQPAAVTS